MRLHYRLNEFVCQQCNGSGFARHSFFSFRPCDFCRGNGINGIYGTYRSDKLINSLMDIQDEKE